MLHLATPLCSENLHNSQSRGPALLWECLPLPGGVWALGTPDALRTPALLPAWTSSEGCQTTEPTCTDTQASTGNQNLSRNVTAAASRLAWVWLGCSNNWWSLNAFWGGRVCSLLAGGVEDAIWGPELTCSGQERRRHGWYSSLYLVRSSAPHWGRWWTNVL